MKKNNMKGKKILSIMLSITMVLGTVFTGTVFKMQEVKASAFGSADFLKTNGTQIKNNYGNGKAVYLRGTNAGGWLVQENWMNPTNAGDQRTMMNTLAGRFGSSTRDELVAVYEDNYWTAQDFDNCASMGMSVIRLPFTYMNLCDDNGNLKSSAWSRLDWFVSNCSSRGMYVILDMHGAFGSQNGMDHSGEVNDGTQLYYNQENKDKTLDLWSKIAEHFKGNPAVAGYDILNEPGIKAAATYSMQWDFYNEIYKTIRNKDSDHIIIMESCWDADNLPRPSVYGWTNVVYEYHYYPWDHVNNAAGQANYIKDKVNDIGNHNYGVPTFVGEFTCFDQEDAWRNTMSVYNQQGWHWTTWSYKATGNTSWGIYNHNPEKVDIYSDSAETIRSKWSNVGTDKGWVNSKIYNVIKQYLPGTVVSSGETVNSGSTGDSSGPVTIYQHINYGGRVASLEEGSYNLAALIEKGFENDDLSSLKVPLGYVVTLYWDDNFSGSTMVCTSDTSFVGQEFNDKTSSIKVTRSGSGSSAGTSYQKTTLPNGKYYIQSVANNKFVVAENGGSDPLTANRDSYSGAWETLLIENNSDGTVNIKSEANNKYVCAVLDGQNQLLPRSDIPDTWEKFQIYKIKDGEYGIRSAENQKFVKADLDNGGKLVATSDSITGAWEAFRIVKVEEQNTGGNDSEPKVEFYSDSDYRGTKVSLLPGEYDSGKIVSAGISDNSLSSVKVPSGYRVTLYDDSGFLGDAKTLLQDTSNLVSCGFNDKTSSVIIEKVERVNFDNENTFITSVGNNKVVCAENGGSDIIVANRNSCGGAWESFQIVSNNDGTVSLKSASNNKYVCVVMDEKNQLIPRSESIGDWEKFIIEKIADDEYAIYALANGKYVQANLNDGGKLYATSDRVAGSWEAFKISIIK